MPDPKIPSTSTVPVSSTNILLTIFSITPSFFNFAGGDNQIGVLNVKDATSISSAMPCGIALEVNCMSVNSTKLSDVQSKKLSVVCNSSAGLNSTKICSSICNF